jgi:hypothetical protein
MARKASTNIAQDMLALHPGKSGDMKPAAFVTKIRDTTAYPIL